jgi:hypothetical protein
MSYFEQKSGLVLTVVWLTYRKVAKCDHAEQIAIPLDDPMKSDAVGWFTGELHPRG